MVSWLFAAVGKPTPNIDRSADPDTHRALDDHLEGICGVDTDRQKDRRTDGTENKQTDGQTDGRYQVHYLPASLKLRGR